MHLKLSCKSSSDITHIISSTSDGAAAQCKFNCLLEKESKKPQGTIVENKCAIHLGVNLRHAQVKAMENIQATDSSVAYDSEGSMDEDMENPKKGTVTLIVLFTKFAKPLDTWDVQSMAKEHHRFG